MNLSCYSNESIRRILQGWERDMSETHPDESVERVMLQTAAWCQVTLWGLEGGFLSYEEVRQDMSAIIGSLLSSVDEMMEGFEDAIQA